MISLLFVHLSLNSLLFPTFSFLGKLSYNFFFQAILSNLLHDHLPESFLQALPRPSLNNISVLHDLPQFITFHIIKSLVFTDEFNNLQIFISAVTLTTSS